MTASWNGINLKQKSRRSIATEETLLFSLKKEIKRKEKEKGVLESSGECIAKERRRLENNRIKRVTLYKRNTRWERSLSRSISSGKTREHGPEASLMCFPSLLDRNFGNSAYLQRCMQRAGEARVLRLRRTRRRTPQSLWFPVERVSRASAEEGSLTKTKQGEN